MLGGEILTKLKVYATPDHPHAAQQPEAARRQAFETRTEMSADKQEATYATGKRKTAVARVWVKPGSGQIKVNGVPGDNTSSARRRA